jgi:hypothetical protein
MSVYCMVKYLVQTGGVLVLKNWYDAFAAGQIQKVSRISSRVTIN